MRFYGIDLHHDNFSVAVIDENNHLTIRKIYLHSDGFEIFLNNLTKEDYLAVESSTNSFWFYDQVVEKVKECFIINPWKLLDIYKTSKKTDKVDAKKIAKKLKYRILCDGDEDDLPTIYVPCHQVRELRSVFSTYKMLIKQKTMVKNRIKSLLVQQGYYFSKKDHNIFIEKHSSAIFNLELPESTKMQLEILYRELNFLNEEIKLLTERILIMGEVFINEIDLLTSFKGISVLSAIAIMSDIADIDRFKSSKKLCSYLRSAPRIDASNQSEKIGKINKQSRKLSIGFILQGLVHIYNSTEHLSKFYNKKKKGKSAGKVRVAIARKIFAMIYQMLKHNEYYRWKDEKNHEKKMHDYYNFLKREKKENKIEIKRA